MILNKVVNFYETDLVFIELWEFWIWSYLYIVIKNLISHIFGNYSYIKWGINIIFLYYFKFVISGRDVTWCSDGVVMMVPNGGKEVPDGTIISGYC